MSVNPLKNDPELKKFLQKLRSLEAAGFPGWRASFLARYESFLRDELGTQRATRKYRQLSNSSKALVPMILKVKDLLDQGDFKSSMSSVKARQTLSELSRQINVVINELDALLPTTGPKEQEIGYSKFTLGAVLLRDNFSEYRRLSMCSESLSRLRRPLQKVVQLEELDRFGVKLQTFCDIISDLGLYGTLTKCSELVPLQELNLSKSMKSSFGSGSCPSTSPTPDKARKSSKTKKDEQSAQEKKTKPRKAPGKAKSTSEVLPSGTSRKIPSDAQKSTSFRSPKILQRFQKKKVVEEPFIHPKDDPVYGNTSRMDFSMKDYYYNIPDDKLRLHERNKTAKKKTMKVSA